MFASKLVLALVLVASSSTRYVSQDQRYEDPRYHGFDDFDDRLPVAFDDEYSPTETVESFHPGYIGRVRRQVQGSVTLNSDGGMGLGAKIPIAGNEKNSLSALGSYDLNNKMQPAARGMGLQLDNVNGHSLTVMKESLPGFGDKLTGAAKVNVFHNDNHDVGVRGSVTRNIPSAFPGAPNFNTVGGGVDYMYKNKVGASLGMASTPFLDRKDYSAMGNLNVFRSPTSSVDFSGGFKKFDTPFMRSNWEPNFGLTFSHTFPNRF